MANSKLAAFNKKIEKRLTGGLEQINRSVTGAYNTIEDQFVERYLAKDGETVTEAKQRLKIEQEARKAQK